MKKLNEYNNIPNSIIKIDDILLYLITESIFGIDEYDPWSFNYKTLEILCNAYDESNNFNYIKYKVEKVMMMMYKLDYEVGHKLKYNLIENEFGQKVVK
jgi:hypothetical protein